jgi:hypothetical protein
MLGARMDAPGLPLDLLVLVVVVIPTCLAVLLGMRAFRGMTPLAFHCRRCQQHFFRKPHRRFPTACPRCRARDWNRGSGCA